MQCPYCQQPDTKVKDSRESSERVRRRRECPDCGRRFTTYETAEKYDIEVIKRDGSREEFDEQKIRSGIERAVEKRPVDHKEVDKIVKEVRKKVMKSKEVSSKEIGEKVKEALQQRDEVAYIRFASVCDSFDDAESFMKEAEALANE